MTLDVRAQGRILNIYKPIGWTSNDVIRRLKPPRKAFKVGHAGTLDPFAKGVLLVCLGRATKKVPELMELEKEYIADIQLGQQTDTLDISGVIDKTAALPTLSSERFESTLKTFSGEILQTPPIFSALKVNGRRMHERARLGETVTPEPRRVTIYSLELLDFTESRLRLRIVCSKGTYVRALARDIASELNTVGYLRKLTRTRIGPYRIKDARDISQTAEWVKSKVEGILEYM